MSKEDREKLWSRSGVADPRDYLKTEELKTEEPNPSLPILMGDRSKLGNYSCARGDRGAMGPSSFTIVNGYTQYSIGPAAGPPSQQLRYDAIRAVFKKVAAHFPNDRIGYPKIGAGLAGGDWTTIADIICEERVGCDHTLVELP